MDIPTINIAEHDWLHAILGDEKSVTLLLPLVVQLRHDPDPPHDGLLPQPQTDPIRVALLENDSLVREGVKSQLNHADDLCVVGETYTGEELFRLLDRTQPHVLILGAHVPHRQRNPTIPVCLVEMLEALGQWTPEMAVILLARHYFPLAEETLEMVRGYILRHDFLALDMVAAVRTVHDGGTFFSETARHEMCHPLEMGRMYKLAKEEVAVLSLLASAPEASWSRHAEALGMSYDTYQTYVQRAMRALRVTNRLAAVVKALQLGILRVEELGV